MKRTATIYVGLALLGGMLAGCSYGNKKQIAGSAPDPCAIALAPHTGEGKIDEEIARLQVQARKAPDPRRPLEKLGWMFVAKARVSYDNGYYKLAEQCARCLEAKQSRNAEALLLRGHVLHNLHRFKEAEKLAHELVDLRGSAFDYALLGDVLLEQGRLMEGAEAYQKMIDLKPCLQSYSRAAHLRWLRGDLAGARELMQMAANAGSMMDRESIAWTYSRLALYELQSGDMKKADRACEAALALQTDYAPALLVRGRIYLAQGRPKKAVEILKRAASLNSQPEYEWTYAESLRSAGYNDAARSVEQQLAKTGAARDPRTTALYLATRREAIETALRLAEEEITVRADVFTLDALAWSLAAAGQVEQARSSMKRALAAGTKDARLFYHAGMIAARAGEKKEARGWLEKAAAIRQMLLPSERKQLFQQISAL